MSRSRKSSKIITLGVMTGTSCDALDAACLAIDANGWDTLWTGSCPYPPALKKRVLDIQKPDSKHTLRTWLSLNRDLGTWYGLTLTQLIKAYRRYGSPDIIANHGQTIGHFPTMGYKGVTLQIGDPAHIAHLTGLSVVSHFREGDLAAGGQGAPLVPLFHQILSERLSGGRPGIAIHNIGGISNLTYVGPRGLLLAFDTGPGNIWIDASVKQISGGKQQMDRDGKLAFEGDIDVNSVKAVLRHPYFRQAPPKSTGRDDFPFEFFRSKTRARGSSLVATATWITVETIAQAYENWILRTGLPLHSVFLCGGGANNPAILTGLQARMPEVEFKTLADCGIDPQYVEAQAFAIYGFLSLLGHPIGGSWTGSQGFAPPGYIVPGKNWLDVLPKIQAIKS